MRLQGVEMPWTVILKYGIPSIMGALLVLQIMSWRSDSQKLESIETALTTCNQSAIKLKETNDGLQKSRDDTASKLRSYKLRQQNCTLSIANSQPSGGRPVGGNAQIVATTDDLYEYAAVCRNYWAERIALEKLLAN